MTDTETAHAPGAQGGVPQAGFVSIVVPALNEEVTIGEFVDWCFEGLRKAGVEGEVIIVDSSSDRTPEIATEHGGSAEDWGTSTSILCAECSRGLPHACDRPRIRRSWR